MKKILLIISILSLLSSCASKWSNFEERVLLNDSLNKSMTWAVLNLIDWINWIYTFKESITERKYETFSKLFDLWNYMNKSVFINWTPWSKWFEIFEITEIIENSKETGNTVIEFTNEFWWYSFLTDKERFTAIQWWEKSIVKNQSWEIILVILSFPDKRESNEPMISNAYKTFWIWWTTWDIKEFEKWFDLWVKNTYDWSRWNLLNFKANYWNNIVENKTYIKQILNTFTFWKRSIINNLHCGWENNITCPDWYYCELFSSTAKSSWKCVLIK